jgi:hypothetical protein
MVNGFTVTNILYPIEKRYTFAGFEPNFQEIVISAL